MDAMAHARGRSLFAVMLAVVISVLGIFGILHFFRRSPKPEGKGGSAPTASSPDRSFATEGPVGTPGAGYRPLSETMGTFFESEQATPPAPSLETVAGPWAVDSESSRLLMDPSGEPIGMSGVAFSFRIVQENGGYLLRWEGPDRPARKLVLNANKIVAQGEPGSPDLTLVLDGDHLQGTMGIEKPFKGRMEFYASRRR